MSSSEFPSDVSKGLRMLNFIDKVADDGKQKNIPGGRQSPMETLSFSSPFLYSSDCLRLSVSICVLVFTTL